MISSLRTFSHNSVGARVGFTLLEMLVVVTIMAVLTTVAVQSLKPVAQTSRIEATERTLDALQKSLLTVTHSAGSASVSGFTADLRRLPMTLMELSVNPNSNASWQGPYLFASSRDSTFIDAWENPLQYCIADGVLDSLNDVLIISSSGTNGISEWGLLNSDDLVRRIPINQFTARDMQIRLYGIDTKGNPVDITATTPQVVVRAVGSDMTLTPSLSEVGNRQDKIFTLDANAVLASASVPDQQRFLVGAYTISVTGLTSPPSGSTGVLYDNQTIRVNVLPGTSNNVEVLVFRADLATTTPEPIAGSNDPPASSE